MPIGTARMAHLSLSNSELHTGVVFDDNARVQAVRAEPGTMLLFPGEGAIEPSELNSEQLRHLIVIDGTWAQARKVLKLNPALRELPRVGLRPEQPGNYRIRKEPSAECLATIEAVAGLLGVLERDPEKFASMLRAFTFMVDQQIEKMERTPNRRIKRIRHRAQSAEEQLFAQRARLLFVHAEVNAHAREMMVPGEPELLHLVAERTSGERFESILAPRRPLAVNATNHLGLREATVRAGETIEACSARWKEFLRGDDLLVGWGSFTRAQLAKEQLTEQEYLDLRLVVARRLQSRPGAPEEAVVRLGGALHASGKEDRAGRVVGALAQVIDALASRPANAG